MQALWNSIGPKGRFFVAAIGFCVVLLICGYAINGCDCAARKVAQTAVNSVALASSNTPRKASVDIIAARPDTVLRIVQRAPIVLHDTVLRIVHRERGTVAQLDAVGDTMLVCEPFTAELERQSGDTNVRLSISYPPMALNGFRVTLPADTSREIYHRDLLKVEVEVGPPWYVEVAKVGAGAVIGYLARMITEPHSAYARDALAANYVGVQVQF